MAQYDFREIECVNACNKVKGGFPYLWDLNIYRGCEHGCKYCFALYTHKYMNSQNFFNEIYVKTNIAEKLEKLLHSKSWKGEPINLGGVTDNYQPAEEHYKLMPEILKLLIKYKNPCTISTKSDLILRDFDLIAELAETAGVNVAATITCTDESIRQKIEPRGASSKRRFEMLKAFSKTKASTGVHIMPVIPFITDSRENLESLFSNAKDADVDYAIVQPMNLRGETKNVFLSFVREEYPSCYNELCGMYKRGYVSSEYKAGLYKMTDELMKKYGISKSRREPRSKPQGGEYEQMSLF
ncbi:MAG: radical SAM protein [Clostridiales bacterium]|nr:radical SAM protein [Clostridiales bacterium]